VHISVPAKHYEWYDRWLALCLGSLLRQEQTSIRSTAIYNLDSFVYKMNSFFSRRHTASRTGRSTPDFLSSNTSKLEQPKPSVDSLYQMDAADASSAIIPSVLSYSSPHIPVQSMSPASTSGGNFSVPPRSHTVPPPTTSSIRFPTNPSFSTTGSSAPQRAKRAPTPPPPYVEQFPSQDEADSPMTPAPCRSRSRTSSTSWIKRVVSRSSSRSSLRKQYEQIPMSEEERIEAEQTKARKAKEALAEWNRINDALKAAGF